MKELNAAGVIGHFAFGKDLLNGQTIKTKIIAKGLEDAYGTERVKKADTSGGATALMKLPFMLTGLLKSCSDIVILPAHRGIRIIVPLLVFLNTFFGRRLHYVVIGGWLPTFLSKRKSLAKKLKKFDSILVETEKMKNDLCAIGFENVLIMPNCKDIPIIPIERLSTVAEKPYKLCTFSRVMKEKGIEDAINAVSAVNGRAGKNIFSLDIYGQVDSEQIEWFEELKNNFPPFVKYVGEIPFDKSTDVLKDYFALLFPTHFYTEGVPGTVIDAYASGLPVIAARWESFSDVITDGVTGIGYDFGSDELEGILNSIASNPSLITDKRLACVKEAEKYRVENAIEILTSRMNNS